MAELLKTRGVRYVTWEDWLLIDQMETAAGERLGRPRLKITTAPAMLKAIDDALAAQTLDILIVGGGPAGLYAGFYAGLRGLKARILEALPEVGGQLAALYPEMDIYDVPGFLKIGADDLVDALRRQAEGFSPQVNISVNCRAESLERLEDGVFVLRDSQGVKHRAQRLILATGIGAIIPNRLDNPSVQRFEGKGVYYFARDKSLLRNKKVLVVGGGDSAVLWALSLKNWAEQVTLIHRSDRFRARNAYVAELMSSGADVRTFHELREVQGKMQVEGAVIVDTKTGAETTLAVDAVLLNLGFHADRGVLQRWGLDVKDGQVKVDGFMRTNLPGVYAVGDTAHPEGSASLHLIATGLAQAALAVNHACHELHPEQRLAPPHSSLMRM